MNEKEAYRKYVIARAEAWAVHDRLIAGGQVSCIKDLDTNEEYQVAVTKEQAAWIYYLSPHDVITPVAHQDKTRNPKGDI